MDIFIARQPIFDREHRLAGYELLYRESAESARAEGDVDEMSAKVVVDAFFGIGLDELTEGVPAFVNVSRSMLLGGYVELLPADRIVVELLETVEPDAEVVAACEALVANGYRLALDDFSPDEGMEPLLRLAEIVKLDVLARGVAELGALTKRLRRYNVRLLAEKVGNATVYDACVQLGFELFQGFHLRRPETVKRRDLSTQHVSMVRLLNRLRDPEASEARIAEEFSSDVALSYKLLKLVNSAAVGGRGIDSIPHALRLVGRKKLYRWLALLFLSMAQAPGDWKKEMLHGALLRARFCELLAHATGQPETGDTMFLVGLFSRLDTILGVPLEDALASIDLAPAAEDALLRRSGPYAAPLALVRAYGAGRWDEVTTHCTTLGVSAPALPKLYVEALQWTKERIRALDT